jgi:hypothetical protein
MKPSPIIVLFGEPPPMRRGPSGFVVSLLFHVVACALLYLGLKQPHMVDSRPFSQRYAVRVMELRKQEPRPQRYIQPPPLNSLQQPNTQPLASSGSPETATAARIPPNFIPQKQATLTLVQPDAPNNLLIPQTALPQVFLWSAPQPAVKKIVQPAPQTVVKVDVRPSIDKPNQEPRISDLKMSATIFDAKTPMPMPSNTSPVSAQNPQKTQQIPQTASKTTGQPTPASVISASNIQLQEGTVTLPMINEVAPAPFTGSLSPGESRNLSQTGRGKTDGKENSAGVGQSSGNQTGNATAAAGAGPPQPGGGTGKAGGDASVTSGGPLRTVVHITLPKDGKFGVVVVGSSLADDYPETLNMWTGRLAYTVYLHVGVTKNWIMQFSLPKLQGAPPAGTTRPDAPFPYDITRPSIDADLNTDAIMVHGFVNAAGRFEQLAVVFPTELAEAKFLLRALQQWQFRPALQNGQATPVEVLLIIPDQTE